MIWEMTTLAECGRWYSGGTPRTDNPEFWNGTIPWISAASMHDFFIRKSDRCVTALGVENGTRLVPKDTIIFVVRGMSLQNEFRIGITRTDVTFGQDCKALVANERFLPLFLAYYLRSQQYEILGLVDEASHGTGKLPTEAISALEVPVPSLAEQRAIAGVLSSLDDKIDLLHRQNKTLESLAETLFRQWFIEEAEDDWEEVPLGNLVVHLKNGVTPSNRPAELFHHFSLPAFDSGRSPTVEFGSQILSNKYSVENGTILVSKLNPRFPRIWPIQNSPPNAVCSTEFQVLKPKDSAIFSYVYFLLTSEQSRDELAMSASGTSGSHQRVRPEDILKISCKFPSEARLVEFSQIVDVFISKSAENATQIRKLESLRDTLLPKLMSGEVRVEVDRG